MRMLLLTATANHWGVAVEDLKQANGIISKGNQTITYAEIAKITQEWPEVDTPALKPVSSYKHVGKPVPR